LARSAIGRQVGGSQTTAAVFSTLPKKWLPAPKFSAYPPPHFSHRYRRTVTGSRRCRAGPCMSLIAGRFTNPSRGRRGVGQQVGMRLADLQTGLGNEARQN
jgi:hypothetical protein